MRILVTAAVSVAFIAACGGGSASIETADDLAAAIGCDFSEPTEPAPGTTDAGTCKHNGADLALATFTDAAARDAWVAQLQAAGAMVDTPMTVQTGGLWVIAGEDAAAVTNAAEQVR